MHTAEPLVSISLVKTAENEKSWKSVQRFSSFYDADGRLERQGETNGRVSQLFIANAQKTIKKDGDKI
jgi:hypothetical protein